MQACASSMPLAPPKEIFTSPPRARIASIWSFDHAARGSYALNQDALHPALLTNASVKFLRLPLVAIAVSDGVGHAPMSTYGATGNVLPVPPPPPPPVGVGLGVGDAVRVGVGLVVPPPVQAAPLILQLLGLPAPATRNPKLVDAPEARVPLYSRLVAVTWVPDWLTSASQ